jgi:protein TonB
MEAEQKKSSKADLENKRLIFRQIGAILVLSMVFLAFEYQSNDLKSMGAVNRYFDNTTIESIPITVHPPKLVPPAPQPAAILMTIDNSSTDDQPIGLDASIAANEPVLPEFPTMKPEERDSDPLVLVPEVAPEYPGGIQALMAFISSKMRYPAMARESNIQGRVYVSFIVEKDGSVSNIQLLRGIGGGCDEEAIRVVGAMPQWQPGRQNGRAVRVAYNLPIRFSLK